METVDKVDVPERNLYSMFSSTIVLVTNEVSVEKYETVTEVVVVLSDTSVLVKVFRIIMVVVEVNIGPPTVNVLMRFVRKTRVDVTHLVTINGSSSEKVKVGVGHKLLED